MNRALLYVVTPDKGKVGAHVPHLLKSLRKRYANITVAVNGAITPEGEDLLRPCADKLHSSTPFQTLDQSYATALAEFGWDKAASLDELTLMSCDLFGPVFPVDEMFASMEAQAEVDVWGLAEAAIPDSNGALCLDPGMMTYRKRLLSSPEFKNMWSPQVLNKPSQDKRLQAQFSQSAYLSEKGYRCTAYVKHADFLTHQPLLLEMQSALRKKRIPFLSLTPFCQPPIQQDTWPSNINQVLPLLEKLSDYPQALFWDTILRKASLRTLHTNLAYQFTFDSKNYGAEPKWDKSLRIAVCAHVFYPDVLEEILERTENIPTDYDLYITTASAENKAIIESRCAEAGIKADVRVVMQNRGRDMASLYIDLKDVILDGGYDLICRLHSKRSPQVNPSTGTYFKHYIFDAVLASKAYTSHLLDFLVSNPHVGMAFAPMIHTGYATMGNGWFDNRKIFANIMKKLGCETHEEPYSPIAAYGTVYWFRPDALRPMFEGHYGYEDYNPEPNHIDGGLAHGQERVMTYVAQARGYMSATVWPDYVAAQASTLLEYKMDSLYSHFRRGKTGPHARLLRMIEREQLTAILANPTRLLVTPDFLRDFEKRHRPAIKKLGRKLGISRSRKD